MTVLLDLMLQATDSLAVEGLASSTLSKEIDYWDLAKKGGLIMVILTGISVAAIAIFIDRLIVIGKAKKEPEDLLNKVKMAMMAGDLNQAQQLCEQEDTPMGRMILSGLRHIADGVETIEAAIGNTAKLEVYKLERRISMLGTFSGLAPMLGFFGTVTGMIQAFIAISQEEGSVSPKLLSSGIYEAMVTTAGGLAVGILAYVFYNYLVRVVADVVHKMEFTAIGFVDLLKIK